MGALRWWRLVNSFRSRPLVTAHVGMTLLAIFTGSVLRTCHHWAGVPWTFTQLWLSSLTQTSVSVIWGSIAIALMLAGNKIGQRWVWIAGAGLIGVVVAKLFLVELAASGTLARIVSFMFVGMLLLLVGFFAPLPPRRLSSEIGNTEGEPP